MQTRENEHVPYHIDLGKGELSGLDKKLLYLLLSKKEQERKEKNSNSPKVKRDRANALMVDGIAYNITLSHSLLPTYKEETDQTTFLVFPRKVKGQGQEAKIKKSKWMITLNHDEQSINLDKQIAKVRIQKTMHPGYIPREATYLKTMEPETTYQPIFNDDKLYIISEFHQGMTLLQAIIENKIQNPILLLKNLAIQLQSLHDKGLIHLDLKPDNIIVNPETHAVMIIDLGCTREKGALIGASGNAVYMTAERADGLVRADVEQDIYAFGFLAYQILVNNLSAFPPHIAKQLGVSKEAYSTKQVIKGDLPYLAQARSELSHQDVIALWEMVKLASNLNPYKRKEFHLSPFIDFLDQIKSHSSESKDNIEDLPESYNDSEIEEYQDIAEGELTFDELHNTSSTLPSHQEIDIIEGPVEIIEEEPEGFDIIKKIVSDQLYWKENISPEDRLAKKIVETMESSIKELNDMIYLNDTEEETHWQKFQGLSMQLNDFIDSLGALTGASPKIENPEVRALIDIIKNINDNYKNIAALENYYRGMSAKMNLTQRF